MTVPRILLFLLTLLLAGCTVPKVDPAREAQADRVYEMVRRGDAAGLTGMATPTLGQHDVNAALRQMQAHVHASAPTGARTLGWTLNTVNSDAAYQVTRLYTHPEGQIQATVIMARSGDSPWKVDGVHVQRVTPEALQAYDETVEAARFTLSGKSPVYYLVLIGAALSAALCLVSAVVAGWRRRWLWMLGCLFGVCQVTLNWTTGALFFQPIYFAFLGAGFLKGLGATDPWLITVAIPLPALFFWGLGKWRPKPPKAKTLRADPESWTTDA
jgi:hypothetical protein